MFAAQPSHRRLAHIGVAGCGPVEEFAPLLAPRQHILRDQAGQIERTAGSLIGSGKAARISPALASPRAMTIVVICRSRGGRRSTMAALSRPAKQATMIAAAKELIAIAFFDHVLLQM